MTTSSPMGNPLDRLTDKLAARVVRDETALVTNPRRARHLFWRGIAGLALVVIAAGARPFLPGIWETIAVIILCWFAGRGILQGAARAGAYRSGWLDGRHSMVASMLEAQERGLTPAEWMHAEIEREAAVLGVPPPPPPPQHRSDGG